MENKKIIFTVTNNLESDQRVHRVASHFHANGWNVLVVGSDHKNCHDYQQSYQTHRIHVHFKKGPLFYAEFNLKLFFFLLRHKTDRIWGNDTDTALATFLASKLKRTEYSLDLHELFPEVPEVTNRKFVKHCWETIEKWILPHIKDGYTVCESIANHYKEKYGCQLTVVRNVPFSREFNRENYFSNIKGKIILYQGAVNEGRGVEWIIQAMPFITNATFVIIGNGDKKEDMEKLVEQLHLQDRVKFLGHIPFKELSHYTNSADLGVCLLEQKGLSYHYALPNRIFDFMQAHVPMLATDFPEISKILNSEKTGITINHYEPEFIAKTIQEILEQPIDHTRFSQAAQSHNWENERVKIKL